ncbi:DedA family protein [Luteipulveratus mongoliensis]|uniref:DedA family protein n=1 Tax=Luteipulveratus mongoliensis TaxID=571913 RepID=UPI00146FE584|nr:VTT domain-containing protein [Luteipulveratus mongoliensis]
MGQPAHEGTAPADTEDLDTAHLDGATASREVEGEEAEAEGKEWWEDPRMPWKGKPGRADLWCWGAISLIGIYGLVTLPLRPILLSLNPYALAAVNGSSIAMVDIGADVKLGDEPYWWIGMLLASLSVIKFDWIFWWAGRLWGHGIIEVIAGRSRWAARTAHHAERLAHRFGAPALFLVWFIPFIPSAIVYAFLGNARMKLRTFLLIDFLGALCNRAVYVYLGYRIGEPAKDVVNLISKYSWYISIALIVGIFVSSALRARKQAAA